MDCDVAVVGAGAAGLAAARELSRGGKTVVLLEARDRIGGRLYEIADPRALAPLELGGEFVHGRPAITYALLREYGATVVDDADATFAMRDGSLQPASDEIFTRVGEVLAKALERDADESVDDLAARMPADIASRDAAYWTKRYVSGFDAADTARASARSVAQEWAGDASIDSAQSHPQGGYAPLIAHLARSLDPERVTIRRRAVVLRIVRAADHVALDVRFGDRTRSLRARRAIVTVPIGVLESGKHAGAVTFEPPLPAQTLDALAHIAMGPVVKVVLCFKTAFWETLEGGRFRDGAFFQGDGAFPTLWTQLPRRANTLVAWAGGVAAAPLADTTEGERIALALQCAGTYFGDVAAAEAAFDCAYTHDWQSDPFARGAYSYVLVGGENARCALAASIDERLWLAGEATASGGEGGTVAGALQSGVRAARDILALD